MTPANLVQAPPPVLAGIMAFGEHDTAGLWGPDELAEILRCRMAAPLPPPPEPSAIGADVADAPTIGDVLQLARPSVGLLRDVSWIAAASCDPSADGALPPEVATVLYYLAAAAGIVRCGERITGDDDRSLALGLDWAARRHWADAPSRALLAEALALLHSAGVEPAEAEDTADLPALPRAWGAAATASAGMDSGGFDPASRESGAADIPLVSGYRITGRLGEGGMGVVWRAVQLSTRREVALKVLGGAGAAGSTRARQRFEREVELASRLEHPHVARVYDGNSTASGLFYYAMELVAGVHLDRFVWERHLGTRDVLRLMRDVCAAVQHAHQRGVIHRDLKPSNVLVTPDGQPHVLDFGLAKAVESAASGPLDPLLTHDGQWAGTPAFMSPEQAAGRPDRIDVRTDVYGLGATLYVLLIGHTPHDTSGPRHEVLRRITQDDVRRPRQLVPGFDVELELLLLKALAHDPERRYASAGELARDIGNYLNGEPLAARGPGLWYAVGKRLRKRRGPVAVALVVVAMLAGTGVFSYRRVVEHGRVAERNARDARRERHRAQVHFATSLVAQGDALILSQQWRLAKARYAEAHGLLSALGESTVLTDLAFWEANRRSPPPLLEVPGAHAGRVNDVAFLPEDRGFVTGGDDGTVKVWDLPTGRLLRAFKGLGDVQRLGVSPDGKRVAVASLATGATVWSLETGQRLAEMSGLSAPASAIAFAPDGAHVLVGTTGRRDNLILFDAATGARVRAFDGHAAAVRAVTFTPDGRRVVSSDGRSPGDSTDHDNPVTVRAWDAADGRPLWTGERADPRRRLVGGLAVSPDGNAAVSTSWDGSARVWDVASGAEAYAFDCGRGGDVQGVAVSPTGSLVAASHVEGAIRVWWMGRERAQAFQNLGGHAGGTRALAFSRDGEFLLSGGEDGSVRLWPVYAGDETRSFAQDYPSENVTAFSVSASDDGRLALTASDHDKAIRLWDTRSGLLLGGLATADGHHQAPAAFLPGTRDIVAVDAAGTIGVWADGFGRRVRTIDPPAGERASSLAVSPDGRQLMVFCRRSGTLAVYDLPAGRVMRTLDLGEARDTGHRLAFSPDGTFAVGCDRQRGLVKVWDVPAWTERHVLNVPLVNRVCVSPDSTRIACVSADVRVIDARSGRTLQRFEGPEDQLNGVAFLPGGQFLVTDGGSGSALVVWDLNDGGRLVRTIGPINAVFDLAAAGNLLVSARERKRGIAGTVDVVDLAWAREYRTLSDELAPMRERLRSNAGDAVALHAYGQWYAFRGAWRWAAKLLQRAREGGQEVDPVLLATCRLRIGDVPGARAEFAAAETRPPAAVGASVPNPAATAALLSKRLDTLVRTPSPMVPAADPGFDAHLTRGFELLAGGAYAEADRAFAAAAALRPERDEAVRHARTRIDLHRATGIADKRGGDLAEAERLAAGVAARYPQDLDAQAAVGWVHYRAGRFANAVEHLGRAVGLLGERDGDRYVLRERFGDTLWRVGRRPEAIATWRRQLDGMGRDGSHHVVRLRAKLATAEAGGDPELAPTAQEREKLRPLNLPPRKPGDPDA